jgi:type II secretory pathway component GspD/PulD (secretin)
VNKRACAIVIVLVTTSLLAGCTAAKAFRRGQDAAQAGDWDTAVAEYTKALQEEPDEAVYKIELERASQTASNQRYDKGRQLEEQGELEGAIFEYRKAYEYNPSNRQAVTRAAHLERVVRDKAEASRPKPKIEQMRERARKEGQPPLLRPTQRIPLVRFTNAMTNDILNFIGMATGINIVYEKDFKPTPFTVQLEDVTLEEALNQVLAANQLWYKVLNERTIQVIPDIAQKRQLYEDQVIRTFYLSHADPQEVLQVLNAVTRIQGLPIAPSFAANKAASTITVRATRGVADIIERIIEANDKPRAEITVDVEILEVNRSRAKQYGLNLSQYSVGTIFSPEVSPTGGTTTGGGTGGNSGSGTVVNVPPFNLNTITQGISTADFYLTVPQAIVRFLASDSRSKVIAKPQLRGGEGTKLTLNLGDEIPVPSTVFTPFSTGGVATQPMTSFSYRNVGVNVEMTPRVSYEGDIMMDISIESSTLGGNIDVAGNSLPTFGTRKVTTRLRLREGEAHLLAGLLREEERRDLRGFPGIMNLPVLRQLISENDTSTQQTDIVMLLTPRIVRTHELQQEDLSPIYIGSQSNIGLTGAPQLIAPQPVEEEAPASAAPPASQPPVVPAVPLPTSAPGVPQPPVAAPAGAQTTAGAPAGAQTTGGAPSGVAAPPATQGVRLPEGSTATPTLPAGSSPIPGTTTLPPPQPASPPTQPPTTATPMAPVPQTPATEPVQPAVPQPSTPQPPASSAAPVQPSAPAPAQVVATAPGSELRVGGGPYTIPISISNASRVSTVSLSIAFNPAVFRVRTVQEGSFMRQGGVSVSFSQQTDGGRVDVTLTRTGDQAGASGAGLIAAIVLEATAAGSSNLTISGIATTPQGSIVPLQFSPVSVTVK